MRSYSPREYLNEVITLVARETCGLSHAECRELGLQVETMYNIASAQTLVKFGWLQGHDKMRQLTFSLDETLEGTTRMVDVVKHQTMLAMEQANLRGELQHHRLEKRMPKRIRSIVVGPAVCEGKPIPAGSMCITFNSGTTIVCTELETLADEFVAKCLMLA